MRRLFRIAGALAAIVGLLPTAADACACCSSPGQRLVETGKPDAYVLADFATVEIAPEATFATTEAFPEDIKGVSKPSPDPMRAAGSISAGKLELDLVAGGTSRGRVSFTGNGALERFEVDRRIDRGTSPGGGPMIYKEWKFPGAVALEGFLSAGGGVAWGQLILHGQGNGCTSAADFSRWTLEVRGGTVHFTLLGAIKSGVQR